MTVLARMLGKVFSASGLPLALSICRNMDSFSIRSVLALVTAEFTSTSFWSTMSWR
jgi:hypothetical protein